MHAKAIPYLTTYAIAGWTFSSSAGSCGLPAEIAVKSTVDREVEKARKCLAAGLRYVALVYLFKKGFIRKLSARLDEEVAGGERSRVHLFAPEELLAFLAGQPGPSRKTPSPGTGSRQRTGHQLKQMSGGECGACLQSEYSSGVMAGPDLDESNAHGAHMIERGPICAREYSLKSSS